MKNLLTDTVTNIPDLAHAARHYRTIVDIFERNLDGLFQKSSLAPIVNHEALALAFSRWRRLFDDSKYLADIDRHDFVIFAAGLMLKELLAAHPLQTNSRNLGSDHQIAVEQDKLLTRWPEGYAYTTFCLSVAAAILQEMGEDKIEMAERANHPSFWDSFRENSLETPSVAIAFFDLVCGQDPNWDMPDIPWLRNALVKKRDLLARSA